MFGGGDYHEVARWLENFATSHAKREDPRAESALDAGRPREGVSFGVRVRLGEQLSPEIELAFSDVASHRGSLAWCQALADRVRGLVREVLAARPLSRPA
ncbi:MAG TPA: hypothetical protein VMI34_01410 [Candidatus Bathyarchaeia archaeon]|nr:hypothetical protein [Candidatus Bathyarchaeia archaeon]